MNRLRTIHPYPVAPHPERARIPLWIFVPVFLILHGIIATCLPERFDPLSTIFIVVAEAAAITACVVTFNKVFASAKTFWLLLGGSIFIHSIAMGLEAATEITQTPILNHVGGFQILLSMFYGVPLLVAVSIQHDQKILPVMRIINTGLSIAVGTVLYFEIFSFLSVHGSANPSDAILVTYWFDAMDVFLAIAGTIRWVGSSNGEERRFFRVLAIFLWLNALLPAVHNRILIHHDYVWLDLLISAPYVALVPLVLTPRHQRRNSASASLVRTVRSGSSVFLAGALVLVGLVVGRTHFYVGSGAVLIAIIGYVTLNIFMQSRGLETEELLLASKAALEKLVDQDGLTGIANRRAFDEVLVREFALTQRTRRPMSVLMIDVDKFKDLNDAKGHLIGDQYLIQIATALHVILTRSTDFVARYGGEEFSAVLPATDIEGALIAAEKLRRGVACLGLCHPNSPSGVVTVSIGVSTFDGSLLSSAADLLQSADRALYIAKRGGRDRSEFYQMKRSVVPFAARR
jgi:diguanylate cyclase (GGDEF)-like protein